LYHERRKLHKNKLLAGKLASWVYALAADRVTDDSSFENNLQIRGCLSYFTEDGALSLIVTPWDDVMGVPENRSAMPLNVTRNGSVRSSGPADTDFTA
jgi:hypothetical protein